MFFEKKKWHCYNILKDKAKRLSIILLDIRKDKTERLLNRQQVITGHKESSGNKKLKPIIKVNKNLITRHILKTSCFTQTISINYTKKNLPIKEHTQKYVRIVSEL